ncbi:YceI family protein [Saccharibacillus sp. CPCC 101409]|uniref:YceI family protein n=1 Tax=Saccharibacillus sp. CPCC 101409 TaxID=3058041 RepID=UPI002670DB84|nr:YceI family protein [Saccharibacillus sp. CPCC 101409]MDO3413088.1 YceI family protein [Saccharibacillus sp. CPCC 101409]
MTKKTRTWLIAALAAVIVIGIGTYAWMKNYMGNNVEIESVLPTQAEANTASGGESTAEAAETNGSDASGAAVAADDLNGTWNIADASKVYFSVTTSQETVNFVDDQVSGTWDVNVNEASQMKGSGAIEIDAVDSGNAKRDEHIKSDDYFQMGQYPQATFTAESFDGLPTEWKEGEVYDFKLDGTLTVKGIEKPVTFEAKASYQGGQLLLSGTTTVTFEDFGMENPHSVVLSTENDINVQLELTLDK